MTQLSSDTPSVRHTPPFFSRVTPFANGFRPFFLLAGINAITNMTVWLLVYLRPDLWPGTAIAPMYWHAHEMLFGFIAAAIAGFLLTAVPNWTGQPPYSGLSLVGLSALWICGRIAVFPFFQVPPVLATMVDLAFFPALALTLAPSLFRARKFRNLPFLALLTALFLANLAFHFGALSIIPAGEHIGLFVSIDIVCVLIVIIGGRIIPTFTKSGLAHFAIKTEITSRSFLEYVAVASIVAVLLTDLIAPLSPWNGAVALAAGCAQALRLIQWQGHRALRTPLVWVLHLGYAWLALGLVLKGLWLLFALEFSIKWIHALTTGAFTTMILAVMTRVSRGHTGRDLIAPSSTTITYILISVAAFIRVFAPAVSPNNYSTIVIVAGLLWIAAFSIFLFVYTPILLQPRTDGRPG